MAKRCTRHIHRGPEDFRPDGRCLYCSREGQKKYRAECRRAYRLVRAIQTME